MRAHWVAAFREKKGGGTSKDPQKGESKEKKQEGGNIRHLSLTERERVGVRTQEGCTHTQGESHRQSNQHTNTHTGRNNWDTRARRRRAETRK